MASSILTRFSPAQARFESLLFYIAPVLLVQAGQFHSRDLMVVQRFPWPIRSATYIVLWFLMTLLGDYSDGTFIYFQF